MPARRARGGTRRLAVLLGTLGLAFTLAATASTAPAVYAVCPDQPRQIIDNFGANDAWSIEHVGQWADPHRGQAADLLFSTNRGIGLSCWRFYLGAGPNRYNISDPWRAGETFETAPGKYDWSRLPGERWFLQAARARGVHQFAMSVYSPPLRLTRNGLSNLGDDAASPTNLKPGAEDEYARYLTDILVHFRDHPDPAERLEFDWVLPVNEPQWAWQSRQEGNRVDNAALLRIYRAVRRHLDAAGLHTQILGPESGSLPDMLHLDREAGEKWGAEYGDYLHLLCDAPDAGHLFDHRITYHSYWSDDPAVQLLPDREALGRAFTHYPGWKIWQSEYCIMEYGRDLGIDSALRVARVIHHDLTAVNVSAWQWWSAVTNEKFKSGLLYTEFHRPGDPETCLTSKIFWTLGNYSRFIRPGMQRIELQGPQENASLLATAFRASGNDRMVFVFINQSEADRPVELWLRAAGASQPYPRPLATYITSASQDLAAGPAVAAGGHALIPARSIVTMVAAEPPAETASVAGRRAVISPARFRP